MFLFGSRRAFPCNVVFGPAHNPEGSAGQRALITPTLQVGSPSFALVRRRVQGLSAKPWLGPRFALGLLGTSPPSVRRRVPSFLLVLCNGACVSYINMARFMQQLILLSVCLSLSVYPPIKGGPYVHRKYQSGWVSFSSVKMKTFYRKL